MRFFSNFSRKNQCPYAHILLRKVHALKNTMLLCPFFVKKWSFSKTRWSHVIFIKFSWKTLCCNSDFWSKNVNSVKTILWAKKVNWKPFFSQFSRKNHFSQAIWQKRPFSIKQNALMLIFGENNVQSLKNTVLSCHFFQILMKIQCCHAHIWSEKC